MKQYAIYLCGGDYTRLDPRGDCPDTLHDWPLPAGYVDASAVADARIAARWGNRKCRRCGLYGWAPGRQTESTNAIRVPFEPDQPLPEPAAPDKTIILHMEGQ